MLILPGHPLFNATLSTAPPPNWREVADRHNTVVFVADAGTGIMRPASPVELEDYLEGGEYDERLEAIGELEEDDE